MTPKEQEGYEFAKGVGAYIARCFILGLIVLAAFSIVRNWRGWGIDDSDVDGWNRSGLKVHTDSKTGLQYLSDGRGGMVLRDNR